MIIKNGLNRLIGISLVVAFILSSCSAAITTVAPVNLVASPTSPIQVAPNTEVPTNTSAPTATPTPVATATQAATPTSVSTATASSPSTAQVVPTLNPYCRKGPASGYDAITFLLKGTAYNVIGRDSLSSWWQVQAPGNVTCWVVGTSVTTQGPVEQVSIASVPPLPVTPTQFENSYVCNVSLKTLSVAFNWSAMSNVTGYRIFRNDTKLVELGPTVTSYSDSAPLKEALVYELEAFNDYGVSARISTTVPACE